MYLMFLRAMFLIRWILSGKSNDNSILIGSFIMLKLRKIWFQAKSIHLYLYCREKTNKIGFIEGRFSNEQRLQVSTIGIFIEGAWGIDWPITVVHVFDISANFSIQYWNFLSDDHCATHWAQFYLMSILSVPTSWFCHFIFKSIVSYNNQCHQPW